MLTIFAVKKQANKITEELKTFYKCFLVKKKKLKKKRNVKFSIPTKSFKSFSQFLAFLINHLV